MSRWANWSRGTNPSRMLSDFLKEGPVDATRTGNPTGTGALSPADRARQLGLQSNGKGGYIDPKTGQIVARTVNNELVFYSSAPGGGAVSDGSGGQAMAKPSTSWQDPISGIMITPPGKPESPNEIAAVPDPVPAQAPAGYYSFIHQKKQDIYSQDKAAREAAPPPAEMDPDEGMDNDPAMQEPTAVPGMSLENFLGPDLLRRTGGLGPPTADMMRDKLRAPQQASISQEPPQDIANPQPAQEYQPPAEPKRDPESMRAAARKAYETWQTSRIDADQRLRKKYDPLRKALDDPSISPVTRARANHVLNDVYDYEGRDNDASSDFTKSEYHGLLANEKALLEAYGGAGGDGSTPNIDAVREFVQSVSGGPKENPLTEEQMQMMFDSLPPKHRKIFDGGTFSSPFAGFKRYLGQLQRSPYTGLPLSIDAMDGEHIIDSAQAQAILNKYDGDLDAMSEEDRKIYDFILSDDNQVWERQGPNQQKSAQSMLDFFNNNVHIYDQFGDEFFDFRETQVNPTQLRLKGSEKDYIGANLVDDSDPENLSLRELDPEKFDEHMAALEAIYGDEKERIKTAIAERFDPEGLMNVTPKKWEKGLADGTYNESDQGKWNMLQTLKSKINGWSGEPDRRLLQALGIPTGMTMTQRDRSSPMSVDAYRGLTRLLRNTPAEKRREVIGKIKTALKAANSAGQDAKGSARSDSNVRDAMYSGLIGSGIFGDMDLSDMPRLATLINRYQQQNEEFEDFDDELMEDGTFDMEDISDVIEMLLTMEADEAENPRKIEKKPLTLNKFKSKIDQ